MTETVQSRRRITQRRFRQSARVDARADDFTAVLILSLSGITLSLFAIGRGWLGNVEYLTGLFLLLQ